MESIMAGGALDIGFVMKNLNIPSLDALKPSEFVVIEGGCVHVKARKHKGANYLEHCTGWLQNHEIPSKEQMVKTVVAYTTADACYRANTCLTTDHGPTLVDMGMWIRRLKYAIGKLPGWTGPLYRGLNLSQMEFDAMKELGDFYIPSFTSATRTKSKAFGGNTVFYIDASDASWTLLMTKELSPNYYDEDEVLLSCYTRFLFISESWKGQKRIVRLKAIAQK